MDKNKLKTITDLFLDCNDKRALEELYKIKQDPLLKIVIAWIDEYEETLEDDNTPQYYMYGDIIRYILNKYKIKL